MISGRVVFVVVLGVMIAPLPAAAQSRADSLRLGDLVVTATRVPMPEQRVPSAVTVLRGDDLRARGVTQVLDALREVPGLTIVQTGSYGAPTSVFLRGGESDYVKVLLDGVPLNVPGGGLNFANLTTADLDRIEIVRGPASVLYGADAMSGVIQLFTRTAGSRSSGELTGRGGTFGASELNGNLGLVSGHWQASATGSRTRSDGTYAFNSQYRNGMGSLRAGYDAGQAGHALLTARYDEATAHYPTDGSGVPFDHNQFTTEHSLAVSLDLARALGAATTVHVQGVGARLLQGATNREDSPADTNGYDFIEDRSGVTWRRGVDARIEQQLRSFALLTIGTGIEHETDSENDVGVSNFGFGLSPDTAASAGARTTENVYGQVVASPVRQLTVQLGARFDHNSAFHNFETWRAGASWQPASEGRIWASIGTAFKAPTFSQLFASSAYEVGNPNLLPVRSQNGEVGAELRLGRLPVRVGVTAFWQQFHDLIQYVNALPGDPNYENLGAARSRGVEATASGNLTRLLALTAQWTWLHTEVTDTGATSSVSDELGRSLIRRPGSMGSATLSWRRGGWLVSATIDRSGSRDDVDFSGPVSERVTLPGYTTVDAALDIPVTGRARRNDLVLTFRGENLFDADYLQTVGYPGRGRTLLAGAGLHF
ncbi:MAG TPA: TonB-dependent receptor [Gemmatimonadales bacterium]